MRNRVLYRQTRRNDLVSPYVERDFLCVCMPVISAVAKVSIFSEFCGAAQAVLRFDVRRSCWRPIRDLRYQLSQNWCIIPSIMFGPLSKNSTSMDLRPWSRSLALEDRESLPKMTRPLLPRRRSVRLISWAVHLSDGLWKSCENTFFRRRWFPPLALKLSGRSCMKRRSSFAARRPGKSVTIPSLSRKKSNSTLCEPAGQQRPHHFIRRVWASGDSTSSRSGLVPQPSSKEVASNLHTKAWRPALVGFLRCTQEEAVGLCPQTQKASGILGGSETATQEVSRGPENSPDSRQLRAASKGGGATVLPAEQYPLDLDAHQCIMAESNRVSVHPRQGIRDSRIELSQPYGTQTLFKQVRQIQKSKISSKVNLTYLKRH